MHDVRGTLTLTTDPARLDPVAVHAYLATQAYWAEGRPLEVVRRSMANSLCFGVLDGDALVAFARVVTDKATFAWLADVYVLPSHRGRGLSKWLVSSVVAHPELQGLRRMVLGTRDAHGLYERFGFAPLRAPERWMERMCE